MIESDRQKLLRQEAEVLDHMLRVFKAARRVGLDISRDVRAIDRCLASAEDKVRRRAA